MACISFFAEPAIAGLSLGTMSFSHNFPETQRHLCNLKRSRAILGFSATEFTRIGGAVKAFGGSISFSPHSELCLLCLYVRISLSHFLPAY
jgi:hypothetical protein